MSVVGGHRSERFLLLRPFFCQLRKRLPPLDELGPFMMPFQMTAEKILSRRFGFEWLVAQLHTGAFWRTSTLAPVAGWAGSDEIMPGVSTSLMARNDVVDGEKMGFTAAILARIIISP